MLERALRIRPDEFKPLLFLSLIIFAMSAGLEMVGNVAEILFFRRVGVEHLPKLYSIEPVVMVTLLLFIGSLVDRLGRYRLLFGLLGGFIAGLLIARLLILANWHPVYPALWLMQRFFIGLAPMVFWVLCSDTFDIRQAKRLFTIILAAQLAGATVGNLLTGLISLWLPADDILLASTTLFLLGIIAVESVRRLGLSSRSTRPDVLAAKKFAIGLPRNLLREPFLQALFWLMLVIGVLEPVVRFELSALANRTFAAEQHLVTFFGLLKAGGALLIVLFQVSLASRLVERLGVPATLSILPLGYLSLLPLLGLFTNIYIGVGVVAFLVTMGTSFHSPARSSVLNLFPSEERGRISASADQLWYVGWLLGSLFLIWAQSRLSLSGINFAAAAAAATWLLILPSLRRRYALTCLRGAVLPFDRQLAAAPPLDGRKDLHTRVRFSELRERFGNDREQSLAVVVEGFKLRDPEVEAQLSAALAQAGAASQPHLFRALRSSSWAVRRGALQMLTARLADQNLIAEAIAGQVRHAFTLMLLTAPVEADDASGLWRKLRLETARASGEACLLLLELIYPPEQMRAVARMIRSEVHATHATGLEALDNLVRFKGKRHLLELVGDAPKDERRRRAARWLEMESPPAPDQALRQLAEFPDGLIRFWARHDALRRRLRLNGHLDPAPAARPEREALPLLAPLIFLEREDEMIELAKKIAALRTTTAFGALSEDELKIVAVCLHEHHFAERQVVCEEGQRGEALYVLVEGRIELVPAANLQNRQTLEPGGVFGEVSVLAGEPYALTAVALTPAHLLSLDRETLNALINYYPSMALELMRALALRLNRATGLLQKDWV